MLFNDNEELDTFVDINTDRNWQNCKLRYYNLDHPNIVYILESAFAIDNINILAVSFVDSYSHLNTLFANEVHSEFENNSPNWIAELKVVDAELHVDDQVADLIKAADADFLVQFC